MTIAANQSDAMYFRAPTSGYEAAAGNSRALEGELAQIVMRTFELTGVMLCDPRFVRVNASSQSTLAHELDRAGLHWTPGRAYTNEQAYRDALQARQNAPATTEAFDVDFEPDI